MGERWVSQLPTLTKVTLVEAGGAELFKTPKIFEIEALVVENDAFMCWCFVYQFARHGLHHGPTQKLNYGEKRTQVLL